MTSKRAIRRKTAQKGLSPVIAAVILIAVTVAIAVAAGGYFFGLFGTQTSRAAVSIRSAEIVIDRQLGTNTSLVLELQNAGGLSDSISSINVPGAGTLVICSSANCGVGSPTYLAVVGANVGSMSTVYNIDDGLPYTFTAGQTVSFTIRLASGLTIPVAVSVQ